MDKSLIAVAFSTLYLLCFIIALHFASDQIVWGMFLCSPFVVILTVFVVIRYGVYNGEELREGEEWGYEDYRKSM